jgi:tRNA threonylcarbamoyladenosine biosynthesis protein TsaB
VLILAFESSAKAASVALCRDGELLVQSFQMSGLTHSRTLLPMARDLLKNTETSLRALDFVAVAHGPGSFTGIRIGVSMVKGLCWGAELPAVGVSTLEAMAWGGAAAPEGAVICPAMDARRSQLYNALFLWEDGKPRRLCPDRAVAADDLAEELSVLGKPVYVLGDGASLCLAALKGRGVNAVPAPAPLLIQSAWGVAMAAMDKEPALAADLLPVYLRLSQAERERQASMARKDAQNR